MCGFGTLDEMFEALTLIQTCKVQRFPVVLFGSAYWDGLLRWLREKVHGEGKIDPDDLDLITVTDSTADAAKLLLDCYLTQCWKEKNEKK